MSTVLTDNSKSKQVPAVNKRGLKYHACIQHYHITNNLCLRVTVTGSEDHIQSNHGVHPSPHSLLVV